MKDRQLMEQRCAHARMRTLAEKLHSDDGTLNERAAWNEEFHAITAELSILDLRQYVNDANETREDQSKSDEDRNRTLRLMEMGI